MWGGGAAWATYTFADFRPAHEQRRRPSGHPQPSGLCPLAAGSASAAQGLGFSLCHCPPTPKPKRGAEPAPSWGTARKYQFATSGADKSDAQPNGATGEGCHNVDDAAAATTTTTTTTYAY